MAVGFSLETTLQGGESLELYNTYAALATVISKPEVHSCAEDRASLLLCLPLSANEQETPKAGCGVPVAITFLSSQGLSILEHPSLLGPLEWLPLRKVG